MSAAPPRPAPSRTSPPGRSGPSGGAGRLLAPLAGTAVAVALWWLVTTPLAAPDSMLRAFAPQQAVPAIGALAADGVLLEDIATSLWRLLLGLLVAGVLGIAIGLAVGSSALLEQGTRPVFQFLRMVSPLAWAPVAIGVFGIGHRPVVFLVAAAAVWPIVLNVVAGVRAVDPKLTLVARSLGASRRETLSTVVLPTVRPHLLTGVRLALGIGWVVLVPAEMLGVTSGLGYEILNSRDQLAYDKVMAVILVIGALGYGLDAAARRLLGAPATG
ncbi:MULTISPECIES: ABC transporter permease [Pseudonocardia]|uniref:Bicarbonate transport system permease protein CmpB n=2 Tax=Pseudonocardia TaxID=1847 RepID=A0A1Y2NAU9_PSEAH|nr:MULTISPECIES: ABC transporter permease [Pseudonocardia]OSY44028.1 Bicarbonate transport system permease protein CmpB [Pseudonocardia autotrophica]TDN74240.1 NitT/TauT family transport system permease protein [Pseudonocardia autotrophica]BBG05003.1 ABC transporter permease [Pseudonocardia autotrophica]GEC28337.1 ABC transporter permease [Pseudonocardia saturnea]